MKKTHLALGLILTILMPAGAKAELAENIPGTFTGSLALTSDYAFRGISQTREKPAVQGGLTYSIPIMENTNIYAGAWASNVDFYDGGEADIELDWMGGITHSIDKLSLDAGFIRYTYPGANSSLDYDFTEIQFTAGYDFGAVFLRGSINYSPNDFADSGHAQYYKIAAEIPVYESLKLTGRAGWQEIEDNAKFGVPDYGDWALGVSYNFKGVDFAVEYADTSLSKSECRDGCDAKAIFTISKSF